MKYFNLLFCLIILSACAPVKVPPVERYVLSRAPGYQDQSTAKTPYTLLISRPVSNSSIQTSDMMYMNKPYRLSPFAQHGWVAPPADMLLPLLSETMENTHYFSAIVSSPYVGSTHFRLDTQLIALYQRFEKGNSVVIATIKADLTKVPQNALLASRRFSVSVKAKGETPYDGVVAANEAISQLLKEIALFTVKQANESRLPQPNLMRR